MNVTPDARPQENARTSVPTGGRWAALRVPTLADPDRQARYERKKAAVVATRRCLQFIDEARRESGISKAELARRVGMEPSAIRRLFSSAHSNPTLETVVTLMAALDIGWDLQRKAHDGVSGAGASARPRSTDGTRASAA